MKKILLTSFLLWCFAIASTTTAKADDDFLLGVPTFNIEQNATFELPNWDGLSVNYPNPSERALNMLNILVLKYDVFVDAAEEPVTAQVTKQFMPPTSEAVDIALDAYNFSNGHSYKVTITEAVLVQANLATRLTDTLSISNENYSISFKTSGPEVVKTIETSADMSLLITDQAANPTVSHVDVDEITSALGISELTEARFYFLNADDSYQDGYFTEYDDCEWRDADGNVTSYWDASRYGKPYGPDAVYAIKVNEDGSEYTYMFYDNWAEHKESDGEGGSIGGGVVSVKPRTTSVVVDWENEDGTITKYDRTYRVEEGKAYVARNIYIANGKAVIVKATLNFLTNEEAALAVESVNAADIAPVAYYSISGVKYNAPQQGLNIVVYSDGSTKKIYVK